MSDIADDLSLRAGRLADLDALVRLEKRSFSSDLISKRSFRRFLTSDSARVLVVERSGEIAGYGLLLLRKGTALGRLYSLAVDPAQRGHGIAAYLLNAAEQESFAASRIVLRLEVREDNETAAQLYRKAGYRTFGRVRNYYQDGCTALRMEKLLHGPDQSQGAEGTLSVAKGKAPYYAQTTDFTCGPACLMMGIRHFDKSFQTDTLTELTLWREATTIYLAAGHGGCGPFGLAAAAARRGISAEVRLSPDEPLFLNSVRDKEKQKVMQLVQEGYRADAAALGVTQSDEPLDAQALAEEMGRGSLALVLISGYRMFGKKEPHWLLVHDADADHLIVHDPWLEHERHESPADTANLPIPHAEFERMARWGKTGVRAQILLRDAKSTTHI